MKKVKYTITAYEDGTYNIKSKTDSKTLGESEKAFEFISHTKEDWRFSKLADEIIERISIQTHIPPTNMERVKSSIVRKLKQSILYDNE